MIPTASILTEEIVETTSPSRTYKIAITFTDTDRINGYIDDVEAIKQAIYLILNTERYQFIIYSWDYGIELLDLFGKPMSYVTAELPRRVKEALTQDDRIENVTDFTFEKEGKKLHTTFTVVTALGNIPTDLEVEV
jgi:phage baseplate assembly protein W